MDDDLINLQQQKKKLARSRPILILYTSGD